MAASLPAVASAVRDEHRVVHERPCGHTRYLEDMEASSGCSPARPVADDEVELVMVRATRRRVAASRTVPKSGRAMTDAKA
jgi:hypothetical protein